MTNLLFELIDNEINTIREEILRYDSRVQYVKELESKILYYKQIKDLLIENGIDDDLLWFDVSDYKL